MTVATSHAHVFSSTPTDVSEALRRLAADLEGPPMSVSPEQYMLPHERMIAVFSALLNNDEQLDARELEYVKRIGVPLEPGAAATANKRRK